MVKQNQYITIMAGGIGSRFWPSSTEETPKQFLDILGVGKSLLRLTFERFLNLVSADRILVVTNKKYKDLTLAHLPDLPENNILCEPTRNNTAPCVAYTALRLKAMHPEAIFVTAPADHVILKEEAFLDKIKQAFHFLENHNGIVTLGIQPTRPDTGYGYIETSNVVNNGVLDVRAFREKPNRQKAKEYLESGKFLWNAGIFVWKASDLIRSFVQYAPEVISVLSENIAKYNTPEEQAYIDRVYPYTPNISVDYAILEKADNVYTIPADIGWSDLGTWNSLHNFLNKDDNDNSIISSSTVSLIDTKNCILKSSRDKKVVIKGLENYIIVDESNALLIYPKSEEQEIKQVVKDL